MTDLAKRAVACKGWRWLPGMLLRKYGRLLRVDAGHIYTDTCGWSSDEALTWKGGLAIDLTDLDHVYPGMPVVMWGDGLAVELVARSANTIAADLFTGLTARVPVSVAH